jgi:hypothetical protein
LDDGIHRTGIKVEIQLIVCAATTGDLITSSLEEFLSIRHEAIRLTIGVNSRCGRTVIPVTATAATVVNSGTTDKNETQQRKRERMDGAHAADDALKRLTVASPDFAEVRRSSSARTSLFLFLLRTRVIGIELTNHLVHDVDLEASDHLVSRLLLVVEGPSADFEIRLLRQPG